MTTENKTESAIVATTTTNTGKMTVKEAAPAYIAFCAALKEKMEEYAVPLELSAGTTTGLTENANWVCFKSTLTGHKFYVPKSKEAVGLCETTLEIPNDVPGVKPLPKVNGKIFCKFVPDLDLIENGVIPLMMEDAAETVGKLRPAKAPVRKSGGGGGTTPPVDGGTAGHAA